MRFSFLFLVTTLGLGCATQATDDTERVLAHIERTTADGKDHYTFEFVEADGAFATLIGSPLGYPRFEAHGCALDTYLSVAPDDAIVPIELRRECAAPGATLDPAPARVDELRPIGTAFEPPPRLASADTGPYCTKDPYNKRYEALMTAAKQVATQSVHYEVCDLIAVNEIGICTLWSVDSNGEKKSPVGNCDPLSTAPEETCVQTQTAWADVPNHRCDHDVVGWGTYGPWLDWERETTYGVSLLQAEVSSCTPQETFGFYWQIKRGESSAWSGAHYVVLDAPAYWIFQLSSGTVDGDWRGAKYRVHANGLNVFPMMAGTLMEGIHREDCPTGMFL